MFVNSTSPAKTNAPNVKRKNDFPSDDYSPQLKKPKTQTVQPTIQQPTIQHPNIQPSSSLKRDNEHLNINPSELSYSDTDFEVEEEDFFSSERIFDQLYNIELLLPDNENDSSTADPEASCVAQLQKRQKYLGNLIKLHQLQLGWIAESFDDKQKALIKKQLKISEMFEQKQRFKQAQSPAKNANPSSYNANSNLLQDRIASQVLNQFGLKGDYNTHASSQELYQSTLKGGVKPGVNMQTLHVNLPNQAYFTQQAAYAQQYQQYQQQQLQAAAAAASGIPKVGDTKQVPRSNPTTLPSAATGTAPFYMPLSPEQAHFIRAGQEMSSAYQQYPGYGYNYPGSVTPYNMMATNSVYPYQAAATITKHVLPNQPINNQKPQLTQQKLVPTGQPPQQQTQAQSQQPQQPVQPQQQ
jgi:hypothetical protein